MMEWLIIAAAGFAGGMLNAVAGGGSFITLPALLFVGIPPVAANATGTAALLPGYLASAWRFRRDISFPQGMGPAFIILLTLVGGAIGAILLLSTSDRLFRSIIPWLVLLATTAFAIGPQLIALHKDKQNNKNFLQPTNSHNSTASRQRQYKHAAGLFAICIYGGYFNGGLGIMLLAAFSLMGQHNLHSANGLKNIVSALLSSIAVLLYALGQAIAFEYLFLLALASIAGGYAGAALAYRLSQQLLRTAIIAIGCLLALTFFLQK